MTRTYNPGAYKGVYDQVTRAVWEAQIDKSAALIFQSITLIPERGWIVLYTRHHEVREGSLTSGNVDPRCCFVKAAGMRNAWDMSV